MFLTRVAGPKPRLIVLGLEIESLARFRQRPMDTHIRLGHEELELKREVILFSAPTVLSTTHLKARDGSALILLDFGMIDRLTRNPLKETIMVRGATLGIEDDILIFSGRDPAEMMEHFQNIGFELDPRAHVRIDPRLKN